MRVVEGRDRGMVRVGLGSKGWREDESCGRKR